VLDSLKRHVVAARAKEDFVGKVGQERQRVVAAGRQVSQSLELGAVGVGQRIDPSPSRERLPVVTQEQLVISTGQERLALFGNLRLVASSKPTRTSLDRRVRGVRFR
jgi:hypothetical protein